MPKYSARWSTKLLDCCHDGRVGQCCYVAWCTPCAFADNVARLPAKGTVWCGGNWCGSCWLFGLMASLSVPYVQQMQTRKWIEDKYGMDQSPSCACCSPCCKRCCIVCLCGYCAICQEARELDLREVPSKRQGGGMPAANQV